MSTERESQREFIDRLWAEISTIESDVVREILEEDPTPNGVHEVAENASDFAEDTTQKLGDGSFKVACKAGCNWCCYQPVRVTPPEILRIVRFIRDLPDNDRESVISRLRDLDEQTRGINAAERTKLRVACAFLKDGLCGIYSVRPLACAGFSSADVNDCKRGYREGFRDISVTHEMSRIVSYKAVQRGVFMGLAQALPEADTSLSELTAAILDALEHQDAETAWLEGEPVFAEAKVNRD